MLRPLCVSSKCLLGNYTLRKSLALTLPFRFFQDISKDLRFRKNAIQAILGPMLMLVPQGHVISFYQANITTIMSTLKSEIRSNPSDEISLGSIEEKSCCFYLMQISFFYAVTYAGISIGCFLTDAYP